MEAQEFWFLNFSLRLKNIQHTPSRCKLADMTLTDLNFFIPIHHDGILQQLLMALKHNDENAGWNFELEPVLQRM